MRPHIDIAARRARLVGRHGLDRSANGVEAAVGSLIAVHSSDPVTPYLAMWARVPGFGVEALSDALYRDRSLWRLHAMRRTLFVTRTAEGLVLQAACARDIARTERLKMERWLSEALDGADAGPWLHVVEEATLAALADGTPRRTQDLTRLVEGLGLSITVGSGRWTVQTPLSSRLLYVLAMEGRVVRAHPAGSWLSSQYHWTSVDTWFDGRLPEADRSMDAAESRARLARRWLQAYGPATAADLQWWTGWTTRRTQAALAAIGAVEVEFEDALTGWVLPDDVDTVEAPAHGVALLPALDPTVMGWTARHWFLGDHGALLFDRNGNAGPTIWVDGRVVGGWGQRPDGEVVTAVLEDVGRQVLDHVAAEAAHLTAWLRGVAPTPRFRTPLERDLSSR